MAKQNDSIKRRHGSSRVFFLSCDSVSDKEYWEREGNMKAWAERFYLSTEWENTRTAYLISQDYICERCGEPAKIVHHKRYLTRDNINDPAISLSWDNLEALCQECHNKEHHKRMPDLRYRFDGEGNILPPFQDRDQRGKIPRGIP